MGPFDPSHSKGKDDSCSKSSGAGANESKK